MREETVKVYKNKENKTIVPREVEIWNDAGWFTSSQQKERAAASKENKSEKEDNK